MLDEEKKAIEELKKVRWNSFGIVVKNEDGKMDISFFTEKHKKTILNLIEKQQNEIQNLQTIDKEHQKLNGELREEIDELKKYEKYYEEIEELKNMKVNGEIFTTAVNFAIKILQELLKEE